MVDTVQEIATQVQEKTENRNSEQLATILTQLSTDQIRFVIARQEHSSDKLAAKATGIKPNTMYHWPKIVKEAVRLMASDGLVIAKELRGRSLAKAMTIKVDGLDSKSERVRQSVSTEIIEWEMGKATQRQEVSGKDGEAVVFEVRGINLDADL